MTDTFKKIRFFLVLLAFFAHNRFSISLNFFQKLSSVAMVPRGMVASCWWRGERCHLLLLLLLLQLYYSVSAIKAHHPCVPALSGEPKLFTTA